jgi:exonuclease III
MEPWRILLKNKKLEFQIQEYNPEIICLKELNFKENYIAPFNNYNGYIKNRLVFDKASGGVATYLKSYIPNKIINIQSEIEVIAVQIKLKEKLTIYNIILPKQKKIDSTDI